MNSDETADKRSPHPVKLALGLAGMLFLIVLALNGLDSAGRPIEREAFSRLVEAGRVESLELHPGQGISALAQGERLWVEGAPTAEEVAAWQRRGLLAEAASPNYSGLAVLGLGLAGGLAYLFLQARSFRRHGSPRQELQDLDEARSRGEIDEEEYRRRSEAAWGKM